MSLVCHVCGGTDFQRRAILWQSLVDEWQISPFERDYIDRQQGETCKSCGSNLRSIALARALCDALRTGDRLNSFVNSAEAAHVRMLELNEAGSLSPILRRFPGHVFGAYPEVDMHAIPYDDESFDVVIHSDTLEHISNPIHALTECRRVLRNGGTLCFTIPVVVGRLSRTRDGLAKSYHGNPAETGDDYAVQTEFGADFWTYIACAGFSDIKLHCVEYPAALAISARR